MARETTSTTRLSRGRRVIALVAVGALVLSLVGVTIALVVGDDDAATAPTVDSSPVLKLDRTWTGGDDFLTDTATADTNTLGTLTSATRLPEGPPSGVVITAQGSSVDAATVTRLTKALGFTEPPKEVPGGWTLRAAVRGQESAFDLDETGGNVWAFGRGPARVCGESGVVPGAGADPELALGDPGQTCSEAGRASGQPSGRAALVKSAADLFKVVGVRPGSGLKAYDDKSSTTLTVPFDIEDLPVIDVALTVSANTSGLVAGSGWLNPAFTTVGQYPLLSADEALAQLNLRPRVAKKTPVTGARLAWLPSREGARTVLVPAWQFEVDKFYGPAIVAIAPEYLAPAGG